MVLLLSFWGSGISTPFVASVEFPIFHVVDVQIIMYLPCGGRPDQSMFMASVGVIEKALLFLYVQSSCWMWVMRKGVRLRLGRHSVTSRSSHFLFGSVLCMWLSVSRRLGYCGCGRLGFCCSSAV